MKLKEVEDCEFCPLKIHDICHGGWTCYGGEPIEPPCANIDGEEELDELIERYYINEKLKCEIEHKMFEKEKQKERINEIKRKKREYMNKYCWKEIHDLKILKRELKKIESTIKTMEIFSNAINSTNEIFGYNERISISEKKYKEIEELKTNIDIAEKKLREKQKDCRKTNEYKIIGKGE